MRGRRNERASALNGIIASIFVLGSAFIGASAARADEIAPPAALDSVGPKQPITAYNGSYTYSILIEVPDFRGIEPKLRLSYDSARGIRNAASAGSWLGVGWKLEGVSAIERVSGSWAATSDFQKKTGGRGSPFYVETEGTMPADNFALDGDELVACAEMLNSPSPSCFVPTASGYAAYTGRVENYLRIRRNTSANTWQVTAKDGTIYSYTALDGGISSTSFRWYLQSVLDRRGNHVDYAYTCATGEECIISTIKYFNQGPGSEIATITFYDGLRPTSEQLTYATGSGILKNARRLKAIKVAFTSGTVRAYAFSYDTSAATGLSRLTSVQQYGRDADVDANGNVTGTALSPTTMSYSALASGSGYVELEGSGVDTTLARAAHLAGDFNGDGITDRYQSAVRRSSPCIAYPPPPEFHSQALASISTGNWRRIHPRTSRSGRQVRDQLVGRRFYRRWCRRYPGYQSRLPT
jgi:hypothetical protein